MDLVVTNISPFTLSLSKKKKKKKRVVLNVIERFSRISLEIKSLISIGTDIIIADRAVTTPEILFGFISHYKAEYMWKDGFYIF